MLVFPVKIHIHKNKNPNVHYYTLICLDNNPANQMVSNQLCRQHRHVIYKILCLTVTCNALKYVINDIIDDNIMPNIPRSRNTWCPWNILLSIKVPICALNLKQMLLIWLPRVSITHRAISQMPGLESYRNPQIYLFCKYWIYSKNQFVRFCPLCVTKYYVKSARHRIYCLQDLASREITMH